MIRCTTIGREPSKLCYEICVIATKCGALKAYEKEQNNELRRESEKDKKE